MYIVFKQKRVYFASKIQRRYASRCIVDETFISLKRGQKLVAIERVESDNRIFSR